MDLGTLATIVSMLAGFVALAAFVRHDTNQVRHEMREFRQEVREEVRHLDDRVYALAAGLNPLSHPGTDQPTH